MTTRETAVAVLAALAALSAFAEKQPYERYKSIVDRQMFGPLPPDFDPSKMPSEVSRSAGGKQEKELTKEQEKLQSAIRFSVINVTPEGDTVVGFTDNSDPKVPVHYYLKVGEERGGWRVESADPKTATMTIVKNDIEVTLTIGGNSGSGGGTVAKRTQDTVAAAGASASLSGRRMQRRKRDEAEREKMRAEMAAKEAEREAKAAEEKAQREAEREEQRQQLMAIQEELRKAREANAKAKEEAGDGADNENNDAE